MGCLLMERHAATLSCTEEYNAVARDFNAGLRDLVSRLNDDDGAGDGGELGGGGRVLADPAAYIEDVAAGCCGTTGRFEIGYMCNEASPMTCTKHLHRFFADHKMNYVFQ